MHTQNLAVSRDVRNIALYCAKLNKLQKEHIGACVAKFDFNHSSSLVFDITSNQRIKYVHCDNDKVTLTTRGTNKVHIEVDATTPDLYIALKRYDGTTVNLYIKFDVVFQSLASVHIQHIFENL